MGTYHMVEGRSHVEGGKGKDMVERTSHVEGGKGKEGRRPSPTKKINFTEIEMNDLVNGKRKTKEKYPQNVIGLYFQYNADQMIYHKTDGNPDPYIKSNLNRLPTSKTRSPAKLEVVSA